MTKRIFRSICFAALSVFLASIVLFMGVLYHYFSDIQKNQLKMQANLAAQGIANEGKAYFDGLEVKEFRITWIDADGMVLYDNESDPDEMENHLQREEIKQALAEGVGESSRYSATLMERSLYCAQRISDGTVVRLSVRQDTMLTLVFRMLQPICLIFAAAFLLSLALASRLSKQIVKPLNELNLDDPLNNERYDELAPLFSRLHVQQRQIKQQSKELMRKQQEFEAVTIGMAEGIVLLNSKKLILSMNPTAQRLLAAERSPVGESILSVSRNPKLQEILLKSDDGKYAETIMESGGKTYQVDATPIVSGNQVFGIVLLFLDVTEKEKAEQMRREFTANVSHELKTPLHTISGCAELMANGMVRQEDMSKFSAQIYAESQRMIRLVEDIIRLSRLDEGAGDLKYEEVDFSSLAEETVNSLMPEAESAGVGLSFKCEEASVIYGIPQLLQGIIYNLCDNAIKYNRNGGSVTVAVKHNKDGSICLSVADTGIGIPQAHRERIFERFYRVDKSHSKAIGGTGLGLSIVKHAARLHDAAIDLQSEINEGTTITVVFPGEMTTLT